MVRRAFLILASFSAMAIGASQTVVAEGWPQRSVKIIAPIPAGGATDLAARLFAEGLSQRWGQSVVVENRPGADAIAGVTSFVNAHDDHVFAVFVCGSDVDQPADPRQAALRSRPRSRAHCRGDR